MNVNRQLYMKYIEKRSGEDEFLVSGDVRELSEQRWSPDHANDR